MDWCTVPQRSNRTAALRKNATEEDVIEDAIVLGFSAELYKLWELKCNSRLIEDNIMYVAECCFKFDESTEFAIPFI